MATLNCYHSCQFTIQRTQKNGKTNRLATKNIFFIVLLLEVLIVLWLLGGEPSGVLASILVFQKTQAPWIFCHVRPKKDL